MGERLATEPPSLRFRLLAAVGGGGAFGDHLVHGTVVGEQAVALGFHVGELGVDDGAETLGGVEFPCPLLRRAS